MKWDSNGTVFEQPPVGAHIAVLIRIVDIGTQKGEWQGKETLRRQNILTWELPFKTREDGAPFIISKFYTQSLGDSSNLTKDLTSWLGKKPKPPFDPKELLGKGCQVVVSEREGSDKKVISTVVGLPDGATVPEKTHNPLVLFSLEPSEFDEEVFDGLSSRIQEMIMKSPEYVKAIGGDVGDVAPTTDDEIPF
jgi:hypothetical protein